MAMLVDLGGGRFALRGTLDYHIVPDLGKQAQALFAGHREIVVDLTEIDRSDSAGVALLLAWQRDCLARGGQLHCLAMPPQMQAIVEISGLSAILCPAAAAGASI